MTFRLALPVILIAIVIAAVYVIVNSMRSNYKRADKLEYNDLTDDSLLKQVNDNLTVIKYCMIFFVAFTILAAAIALIAYIVHLLM